MRVQPLNPSNRPLVIYIGTRKVFIFLELIKWALKAITDIGMISLNCFLCRKPFFCRFNHPIAHNGPAEPLKCCDDLSNPVDQYERIPFNGTIAQISYEGKIKIGLE